MLQFIYTGKLDDPFNDAEDIDIATELLRDDNNDKYEWDSMKALCEEKLASFLYEENCLKDYILADSYQEFELKKRAGGHQQKQDGCVQVGGLGGRNVSRTILTSP